MLVTNDFLTGAGVLTDYPLHLIGHSRGGSLVTAIAAQLYTHSVDVEHLTTLDPHPVDGFGGDDLLDWGDRPMDLPGNVIFADNYYREDGLNLDLLEVFDFDGESVDVAFNYQLDEELLGGDEDADGSNALEHSDVTAWYIGTAFQSIDWENPPMITGDPLDPDDNFNLPNSGTRRHIRKEQTQDTATVGSHVMQG